MYCCLRHCTAYEARYIHNGTPIVCVLWEAVTPLLASGTKGANAERGRNGERHKGFGRTQEDGCRDRASVEERVAWNGRLGESTQGWESQYYAIKQRVAPSGAKPPGCLLARC